MCEQGSAAAKETSTLGYSCEKRPYMTVILILSILILIILRKSSFIKVRFFTFGDMDKNG
jgi:hypothetical protein